MTSRLLFLLTLSACTGTTEPTDTSSAYAGPTLTHQPPASPGEGEALPLSVTATDPDGVAAVTLFYRVEGAATWVNVAMEASGTTYSADVPAEAVGAPAIEYYFKASDFGDPSATSYLPAESTSAPFSVPVTVVGRAFPFFEPFEPPADELAILTTVDWHSASLGFRGYGWELAANTANAGSYSVTHGQVPSDATQAPDDWLVSPPLDLTGAPTAQVVWYEHASSPEGATHGLYISSGSPIPNDGEYVAVNEALPAVEAGDWSRSPTYDLSAWVGKTVYLAWRYQGVDADDWYIDDVAVTELQADLSETLSVEPAQIHPGESGTVTVTVVNAAPIDAENVTVELAFPEGGASVDPGLQTVGVIAAGASATTEFPLVVDTDTANNSYVPMTVTLTSGDVVVTDSVRLLIGQESTATVDWLSLDDGPLKLTVGVGDPDAPDYATELVSTNVLAGNSSYTADITDAHDWLAPAAGPLRWWVKAESESGGAIQDFAIEVAGIPYDSTMAPLAIDVAGSDICYLPEPPAFALSKSSTSPATLSPGDSGVVLSLTLRNDGAGTSGDVTATLSSTDIDLTVVDGGPVDLGTIRAGASASLTSAFVLDVASTHVDSSPVTADLTLDDGVESWVVPVSLAVPFPVMRITGITIDDDDGDGILDPDESADLEFRVTNVGDEASSGLVKGVLSVAATSTATATTGTNTENVGSLGAGDTEIVDRYTVEVVGGAVGDTVDLELTLTDSARTYVATTQLVLGEAPWQPMNDLGDNPGDVLGGYDFDAIAGWYRVVDGVLQMRIVSDTPFDGSRLFLEAWAESPASDYGLYRILAQSGGGALQGYSFTDGTFYNLPDPVVSYPDATTVELDITISDLALVFDEISLGWGIGWCGGVEAYCDQYPDAWGYPYTGYSTLDWYTLSW